MALLMALIATLALFLRTPATEERACVFFACTDTTADEHQAARAVVHDCDQHLSAISCIRRRRVPRPQNCPRSRTRLTPWLRLILGAARAVGASEAGG